MSLLAFLKRFPDADACWAHLEAVRWPDGPLCPKCGSVNNAHFVGCSHYRRCNACRAKFKVTHGTPLEGTHLSLRTWFTALYLVAASSCTKGTPLHVHEVDGSSRQVDAARRQGVKGISSVTLGEHLGVGQKTAWFLGQRIRRMMEDRDGLLSEIVEADETYLGGKKRKRGKASKRGSDDDQPKGRSGTRKSMVTVAAERGGRARAAKGKTQLKRTIVTLTPRGVPYRHVLRNLDIG